MLRIPVLVRHSIVLVLDCCRRLLGVVSSHNHVYYYEGVAHN